MGPDMVVLQFQKVEIEGKMVASGIYLNSLPDTRKLYAHS